ncbi:MAG: hypothetical protein ACREFL_03005, partial [Stellaceae bacterium]
LFVLGILLGTPIVLEFLKTGLVPRLPTAVLATGLVLLASLSCAVGLILDTVARGRKESKRLVYLAIPGIAATPRLARLERGPIGSPAAAARRPRPARESHPTTNFPTRFRAR